MKKYSLFELQSYLHRVIALNFQEPLWVIAEIFQLKESRGHIYLDLVEKQDHSQEVKAQCPAVIWSRNLLKLKKSIGPMADELLKEGVEVSLQVEVTYHPVYGLKLSVLQLDPQYTLGKMELLRQETILQLKKEGLLDLNTRLAPPLVFQRVAIISSENASGYRDFIQHLIHNEFGYQYDCTLFGSAMQGIQLERDIVERLEKIQQLTDQFDSVVIIRGGGSKLDLAGFDLYSVSKAIALCSLPVLTGIGHDTDTTVSDLVAFRSFKTPTAVANFLIDHNAHFEGMMIQTGQVIMQRSLKLLHLHRERMRTMQQRIWHTSRHHLHTERKSLEGFRDSHRTLARQSIFMEKMKMKHLVEKISLLNPMNILEKGYSITFRKGVWIKTKENLKVDDVLSIRFNDGQISTRIEKT